MSEKLGEVYVDVVARTRKLERDFRRLEKSGKKSGGKVAESFNKAKLALAGFAIAIGAAVLKLTNMASAADETQQKFDVVFKGVKGVNQQIKTMSKETGFAVSSLNKMTSSLGDLIKPAGFAADEAFKMSKEVAQLALDIGSFSNVHPEKVIQDFQSALAGSAETMLKYGIDVKEMTLAEEAFNMGLISSRKEFSKLEPAVKRQVRTQALISKAFKDSKDAIGDLERTSSSYANVSNRLGQSLKTLGESVGRFLIPTMTKLSGITDKVVNSFNNWLDDAKLRKMDNLKLAIKSVDTTIKNLKKEATGIKKVTESINKLFGVDADKDRVQSINKLLEKRITLVKELAGLSIEIKPQGGGDDPQIENEKRTQGILLGLKLEGATQEEIAFQQLQNNKAHIFQNWLDKTQEMQATSFEEIKAQWADQNQTYMSGLSVLESGYDTFVRSLVNSELSGAERRRAIWTSMKASFIGIIGEMAKEFIIKQALMATVGKSAQSAAVATSLITGRGIASAYSTAAALTSLSSFGANAIPATAGIASTIGFAKAAANFQEGAENFVVPQGFPNDSFTAGFTTGEVLNVTPANQTTNTTNNGGGIKVNVFVQSASEEEIRNNVIPVINELVEDDRVRLV